VLFARHNTKINFISLYKQSVFGSLRQYYRRKFQEMNIDTVTSYRQLNYTVFILESVNIT